MFKYPYFDFSKILKWRERLRVMQNTQEKEL